LLSLAAVGAILCGIGGAIYCLARYEKAWYANASLPPGPAREKLSQAFYQEFCEFVTAIAGEREWYGRFTDEQVNSYLEEGFVQSGLDTRLLPEGISQPRFVFEADRLRFGFRYGSGTWSTVVSFELRPWVPAGEQNVLALELAGLHAGVLPVKAQSLLERIAQAARDNGIEMSWYRYNGHPVAVLRFQADLQRPTVQLQRVELRPGSIMIRGTSPDGTPRADASDVPARPSAN
jgi:hypothetical protein